jgi:hypothetical protein
VQHRAKSAADAIEAMELLRSGGGVVLKIVVTRTGKEISVAELQLLARLEQPTRDQSEQRIAPSFPWRRRRTP